MAMLVRRQTGSRGRPENRERRFAAARETWADWIAPARRWIATVLVVVATGLVIGHWFMASAHFILEAVGRTPCDCLH